MLYQFAALVGLNWAAHGALQGVAFGRAMKPEIQIRATMLSVCRFALFCALLPTIGVLAINVKERTNTTERLPATVKIHAIQLNQNAFDYAKELIKQGHVVADGRDAWRRHQPSTEEENDFIRLHGFNEYAKWHLGIDDAHGENTKARYKFPYGDFNNLHRCALLAARSRAGQYKHYHVENAALELDEMISVSSRAVKKP
jgi:uncharacterized membrane protein (Fun14 family)